MSVTKLDLYNLVGEIHKELNNTKRLLDACVLKVEDYPEELLLHLNEFSDFIDNYKLRGIKGPVATQLDMAGVLKDVDKAKQLEKSLKSWSVT